MTNADVVRTYLDALNRDDLAAAQALLSDDFAVVPSSTGTPLDADAYMAAHAEIARAFPDLHRHVTAVRDEGPDTVRTTEYITATHDHDVHLPVVGIDALPATGRRLRTPPHDDTFTLRDGRIVSVQSHLTPGTGLPGLIAQIRAGETA